MVKVDQDSVCNVLNLEDTNEVVHEEPNQGASFNSHFSELRFNSLRCKYKLPDECSKCIAEVTAGSIN
ncbi:MAG: hypothetical protein EZS28_010761 [Streblomastix strix]|uniref:Uncharacterized protein n=1 Tax=Streblomastix strix TaxID=222440 RepID=A0A5J4WH77_9EUKA|nr:MAG: hypothetical protein EZS28_010761 [Streblomastix strix]